MSILSALYCGASGIAAMSKSMQVIGNNIANVSTVGFKGSRAEFADLLSQSINTPAGKKQIGRGVKVEAVQSLFHQGSFESTSVVTDVALNGSGFFVLTDGNETYFTRAGQFRVDSEGYLTNALGMYVDGFLYDASGLPTGTRGPINLSSATALPNSTGDGTTAGTGVFLSVNLDSREAVPGAAFNALDPAATSNFSTSLTVYDSLGAPHTTTVYFNKTADNAWEWHALVDGGEIVGGTAGTGVECAGGTLSFDTTGAMTGFTVTSSDFDFVGGATANQVIGFDFTGTSQVAVSSVVNSLTQDGYGPGALQAIDIDSDGVITGVFTNGVARPLAQFTIASFPAESNLFRIGDSLFEESVASGQAVYSTAGAGTNGSVAASTLELSNVDLTTEFITLIAHQRAFQANSKIITAGDELLQDVINMKR
ncbi:flagellar hook protein FlgE [Candidatus Sumerlaeota bacterium]|nr:flagellar hook protein FlgE [Candidatus Sumerlaeota bacterium]